ncbi:TPA: hypothetical protein L5674_006385 [Pseudomonas aeruginosa]|nr:hypothetical protein [Pseudomonas aeruginosa]
MSAEMSMQQLVELAAGKRWWVWTIGVCPRSGGPILCATPLLLGVTETLFELPLLLRLDEHRANLFVDELNRLAGWDEHITILHEKRLAAQRAALPAPTVGYFGQA